MLQELFSIWSHGQAHPRSQQDHTGP
jgi:hypothetical protein